MLFRSLIILSATISLSACQSTAVQTSFKHFQPTIPTATTDDWILSQKVEPAELATSFEALRHVQQQYDPYAIYPDDLWQVMRRNFKFDLTVDNKAIRSQLNYYAKHQRYLDRVAVRASRYMHYVMAEIIKRDMPMEIALLPIVESAFDPFAYSHGSASGMWQFIPSTGKMYGLKQDWWYDGRRDVVASTNAALDYLQWLADIYDGDYMLALASYNSGPGRVINARKKNRKLGKPVDFWSLDLPAETEAYVPKMLALGKLFIDPAKYNVVLKSVPYEPYFAQVDTISQIDLAQAAQMADIDLDELYLLNPGYNRWATSPQGPHKLLIPIDQKDIFEANLAELPKEERVKWERYKIENGDSISTIAQKFNTTQAIIIDINNINKGIIRAGDTLLIPVASKNSKTYGLSANSRLAKTQSRNPNKNTLEKVNYTVKSGDSFWSIGKKFDVTVGSLAKWNAMAPKDALRKGQKLVVWVKKTTKPGNDRQTIRKVNYKVRNGDSLARIADKFNVRISDIKKWNKTTGKYIHPGDALVLYVNVTSI